MLYIIGLGVGDELDISLKGLEACEKCEEIYVELYTSSWQGNITKLQKIVKKKIEKLARKDLEEKSTQFVKKGKNKAIALLVPGDPLIATTHINLVLEAKKGNVPFKLVHSSSILTAIAETGLNVYNFGKTATVVGPQKRYAPTSFYDVGIQNKKLGMHTLFLLDVEMDTKEGLEILLGIEKKKKKGLLSPESKIVAARGLGLEKSNIRFDPVKHLLKKPLPPPAVLIVPGKLHFIEKEFLGSL